MKNNKLFIFLLISGIILSQSCENKKQQTLFTTIMKTSKGDIRGINLNSDINTVRELETKEPDSISDNYLFYNILVPEKYSQIKIEYNFDENGLYSANISVKILNPDSLKALQTLDTLQSKIKKLFTKKHGNPFELTKDILIWNYSSESGTDASVQLINNTKIENIPSLEILLQAEV